MEYIWKSPLWIVIFERATTNKILLTDDIQSGGSCSVNYYKLVWSIEPWPFNTNLIYDRVVPLSLKYTVKIGHYLLIYRVQMQPNVAQNHINSLKYFSVFLLNCKIFYAFATWKELIRKSLCLPIFRNITEIVKKKNKSLYAFKGRCHKITDVCMDL